MQQQSMKTTLVSTDKQDSAERIKRLEARAAEALENIKTDKRTLKDLGID